MLPKFQIEFSFGGVLTQKAVDAATEQMLLAVGTLNWRILSSQGNCGNLLDGLKLHCL